MAQYRNDNKPDKCPLLGHENFTPVVDHDHKSGRIRGVVSSEGNALLGKIENFYNSRCINSAYDLPETLRAIAEYLESEQGPLHPVGVRQLVRRFKRSSKNDQIAILDKLQISSESINECKNSEQRSKLYRKYIVK